MNVLDIPSRVHRPPATTFGQVARRNPRPPGGGQVWVPCQSYLYLDSRKHCILNFPLLKLVGIHTPFRLPSEQAVTNSTYKIAVNILSLFCVAIASPSLAAESASDNWKALEKNYAEANLELAQARLAQAKNENEKDEGAISQGTMAELQAGVKVAQERIKLLSDGNADTYAPQISAAESTVKTLEAEHAESIKANKIDSGSVTNAELRREAAEIAVAKARFAALKVLSQQPPEVRLQWELSQLRDQIAALWARPLIED